jgi:hypothetical protein
VVAALKDWGIDDMDASHSLVSDILLIVSELSTNALQATAEAFRLAVAAEGAFVDVAVEDSDPRPAEPILARPDQTNGRGLALVAALSAQLGSGHSPRPGQEGVGAGCSAPYLKCARSAATSPASGAGGAGEAPEGEHRHVVFGDEAAEVHEAKAEPIDVLLPLGCAAQQRKGVVERFAAPFDKPVGVRDERAGGR